MDLYHNDLPVINGADGVWNRTSEGNGSVSDEFEVLRHNLIRELMSIDDCPGLSDEELVMLSEVYAYTHFMDDDERGFSELDEHYIVLDYYIAEDLNYRCRKARTLEKQAMFLSSVIYFTGASPFIDKDAYTGLIRAFIKKVEAGNNIGYEVLHAALWLLQHEPVTELLDDSCHYNFSIGKDFYESTIRHWVQTQNADGSWTNVPAGEAYGRINVVASDSVSIADVNNDSLTMRAYRYYSQAPCNTPKELYNKFQAYCCTRENEAEYDSIIQQAMEMFKHQNLSLLDRLYLCCVVM